MASFGNQKQGLPGIQNMEHGAASKGEEMAEIGFGTYRVSDENPEHIEALRMAVSAGVRLIDTSTNYMDGGAERAIAKALRFMEDDAREKVQIISKFGYIQGSTMARLEAGEQFEEVVEYAPHVFHCIHPDFMWDQLERSLERLQASSLECYLIHNPEYFLLDALNKGQERSEVLDAMNDRLYRAFVALEKAAAAGKIDGYGVSSNSFAKAASDPEFLPYGDLVALAIHAAESAGNAHNHFTTVQLPLNLLETEGLKCAAWAKEHGLRVLSNRPLNAQHGTQMYRLADYPPSPSYDAHLNELLQLCDHDALASLGNLIQQLDEVKHRFGWVGEYESFLYGQVMPHIRQVLEKLGEAERGALAQQLVLFLEAYGAAVAHECSLKVRDTIGPKLEACERPLQECALAFLLQRPEIDVVLLGMRKPRYVATILEAFPVD